MRGFRIVLTIGLCAMTGSARAGIYCSLDQIPYPVPTSHESGVKSKLADVRAPQNTTKGQEQVKEKYLAAAAAIEKVSSTRALTLDERIDLSGLYLRVGRYGDAERVLRDADPGHFLVLTHLAVVYQNLGLLERAVEHQQKALDAWPTVSLRFPLEQLTWYRRAEQYYLKILTFRQQEMRTGKSQGDAVDPLFPRFRLETSDRRYELGGPSQATRLAEDVPADAVQLVAQLVWWLPFDNHLYWLYGELLNYHGRVIDAADVLEELTSWEKRNINKGRNYPTLDRHARALQSGVRLWKHRRDYLWAAHPRSPWMEPGGTLVSEAVLFATTDVAKRADEDPLAFNAIPGIEPEATQPTPPASGSWLPDWRTVVVSFAAGMIVMALLRIQWREWRRRRGLSVMTGRQLTG